MFGSVRSRWVCRRRGVGIYIIAPPALVAADTSQRVISRTSFQRYPEFTAQKTREIHGFIVILSRLSKFLGIAVPLPLPYRSPLIALAVCPVSRPGFTVYITLLLSETFGVFSRTFKIADRSHATDPVFERKPIEDPFCRVVDGRHFKLRYVSLKTILMVSNLISLHSRCSAFPRLQLQGSAK